MQFLFNIRPLSLFFHHVTLITFPPKNQELSWKIHPNSTTFLLSYESIVKIRIARHDDLMMASDFNQTLKESCFYNCLTSFHRTVVSKLITFSCFRILYGISHTPFTSLQQTFSNCACSRWKSSQTWYIM